MNQNNKQRKVLLLTHTFPPENGSTTQRPKNFAKYLQNYNWKPFVVTPEKHITDSDYVLKNIRRKGVSVNTVFSCEPAALKAMTLKIFKDKPIGKVLSFPLRVLLKIYSIIYYRVVIVSWQDGWIPFGFRKGMDLISRNDIDLIYAHGLPSVFIIGSLLKMITGKPLVIDYDDSWTTTVYERKRKGIKVFICRYLESKILKIVDRAVSVKPSTIEEIMEYFPCIDREKLVLITNGYDPEESTGITKKSNSKFIITYTGTISDKFYYSPETFLNALAQLIDEKIVQEDDISFLVIGNIVPRYVDRYQNMIKELGLQDVVKNIGLINHRKCIEYQMNSDLLLYILESLESKELSYEFSGALPAKIFEYIYTGIPIMAITPPGFEADLIKRTGTGFIAEPNNVDAVKALLQELYRKHKSGTLRISPDMKEINNYDRKKLTGRLSDVFNEVI